MLLCHKLFDWRVSCVSAKRPLSFKEVVIYVLFRVHGCVRMRFSWAMLLSGCEVYLRTSGDQQSAFC